MTVQERAGYRLRVGGLRTAPDAVVRKLEQIASDARFCVGSAFVPGNGRVLMA